MAHEDMTSIRLLKNLFDRCNVNQGDSSDSENEGNSSKSHALYGPGNVKTKSGEIKKSLENPLLKKIDPEPGVKSIEQWEKQQMEDEELLDTRKQPEYSITYKQAVTTEDLFLQMGLKTPATSSCEDMIIEIQLPDETVKIDQMDLSVECDKIHLQTPVYRLKMPLPHKVDPKKGRAAFDTDMKVLKLTLKMNREYDFVNF